MYLYSLDLGRAEQQVVDPARAGVDEAVLDAVDDCLEGHVQVDHDVDRRLALQSQKLQNKSNLLSKFCEPKVRLSVFLIQLLSHETPRLGHL